MSMAGDIIVKRVDIRSNNGTIHSVLPQVRSIELYECLGENFLSGKLFLNDSQSISTLFPFVGNEFVTISLSTPILENGEPFERDFFVYAMSEKQYDKMRNSYYTLSLSSPELLFDLNQRISRTFRGTATDMLTYLVGEKGLRVDPNKSISFRDSNNSFTFCANWWNPTKCIQYIVEHSENDFGDTDFLFFETKKGFVFDSLSNLCGKESPVVHTFSMNNYARNMSHYSSAIIDTEKDFETIQEIQILSNFDYIERMKRGYYGGSTISFNPLTLQYSHCTNDYNFVKEQHLNDFNVIPDTINRTPLGYMKMIPNVYNNFSDLIENSNYEKRVIRDTILARLETTRVRIRVWGRLDYSIGQKVYLSIPKATQVDKGNSEIDPILSGNYLIESMAHSISGKKHLITMELVKDSYIADISSSTIES